KAVKEEYKKLSEEVFPELSVGMLHGKMTPKEKEKVFKEFRENKIKILVATSVIEVGVNVPNATVILIEGAERFGLAQLHQLRGRVMRSERQPYCFLFTESSSQKTKERLKALAEAKNGFELAERDLELRGAGELSGGKQWGISDVGMEALKNIKMVEAAREEARYLIESGELEKYPALFSLALKSSETLHFE
ncbi:MAG: helicase-related protein, partial [Patescibacteria group bacterium]